MVDLRRERAEGRLVRRNLAGERHRHERAAVEAAAEGDHARAPGVRTRDLDRVLDCLRTGGDEDGLLGRRTWCQAIQLLGQFDGDLVRRDHEAGVRECLELPGRRGLHLRVEVTGVDHRDAGGKINVTTAFRVPELRVPGSLDKYRQLICNASGDGRIAPLLQILVPGHRRHLGQSFSRVCAPPRATDTPRTAFQTPDA